MQQSQKNRVCHILLLSTSNLWRYSHKNLRQHSANARTQEECLSSDRCHRKPALPSRPPVAASLPITGGSFTIRTSFQTRFRSTAFARRRAALSHECGSGNSAIDATSDELVIV